MDMVETSASSASSVKIPADQRVRILLVDDQPANLLALEAILGDLGYNLVKARSGKEAIQRLLTEEFALILLDVQMPDLDGFETAQLIRGREESRRTPIIFLTAFENTIFVVEAEEGVTWTKPEELDFDPRNAKSPLPKL